MAPFNYFGLEGLETQLDGVERLAALQAELGAAVLLPPHDPSGYTGLLLEALADGALSEDERAAMLAYQAALYGEDGALLEAARPRYEGGAWALAEP